MPNQNVNKVIYGGRVLIDLTGDTVDPSKLLKGSKAHDKSGAQIEGACTFDVDSTDATAVAAEILFGKTAYVSGNKLTGTMKNNGAVTKKITTRDEEVTIPQGFHDGSGKVGIDATEKGKLIANNIREGVTIPTSIFLHKVSLLVVLSAFVGAPTSGRLFFVFTSYFIFSISSFNHSNSLWV